jgi:hypothetical protein
MEIELPNDLLLLRERSGREERASVRTTYSSVALNFARSRSSCSCSSAAEAGRIESLNPTEGPSCSCASAAEASRIEGPNPIEGPSCSCASAAEAGKISGCRGETPQLPLLLCSVADAQLGRTGCLRDRLEWRSHGAQATSFLCARLVCILLRSHALRSHAASLAYAATLSPHLPNQNLPDLLGRRLLRLLCLP